MMAVNCHHCGAVIPAGQLHCLECLEETHVHGGVGGMHLLKLTAALRLVEEANRMVLPLDPALQAEAALRAAVEQTRGQLDRGGVLPMRTR